MKIQGITFCVEYKSCLLHNEIIFKSVKTYLFSRSYKNLIIFCNYLIDIHNIIFEWQWIWSWQSTSTWNDLWMLWRTTNLHDFIKALHILFQHSCHFTKFCRLLEVLVGQDDCNWNVEICYCCFRDVCENLCFGFWHISAVAGSRKGDYKQRVQGTKWFICEQFVEFYALGIWK